MEYYGDCSPPVSRIAPLGVIGLLVVTYSERDHILTDA